MLRAPWLRILHAVAGSLRADDHRRTLFVAGTGRSGTTWLAEILNYHNRYRVIFEPFRRDKVPAVAHFAARQYLRADTTDPRYIEPVRMILGGQIRNPWVDGFAGNPRSRFRLVKAIRANLLLKWMSAQFPGMPIVLILRHPCAVAHSQLAMGWEIDLEELFLRQEHLVEDHLRPFLPVIHSAGDTFARAVLLWCVENGIPIRQFQGSGIHIVFYEALVRNPEHEIRRLADALRLPMDAGFFHQAALPSQLTRAASPVRRGQDPVEAWRGGVTQEQLARAQELLEIFGVGSLYQADDPIPATSGLERVWTA